MTGQAFLHLLAEQLVSELRPNETIRKFTTNSAIIGAYAEASLRQFISRVVAPLRVSTGAVISEQLCSNPSKVPQVDVIIWSPSPSPAIFHVGDFGLVPRSSCFGVMEIKRSAYGVGKQLENSLAEDRVYGLVGDVAKSPQMKQIAHNNGHFSTFPGIGVVCVKENDKTDAKLDELIEKGVAVVLFDIVDGQLTPRSESIHRLVNFLILTRLRARIMDGLDFVNVPLLEQSDTNLVG